MVNLDIYKLRMIENIEINSKNKLSNLICHHNYQTWHFSTSCALPIALLMNKLEIATNLGIQLTKLIIPPAFGLIVRTAPRLPASYDARVFLWINQLFPHRWHPSKFRPQRIIYGRMVHQCTGRQSTDPCSEIPLLWIQTPWPTEDRANSVSIKIFRRQKRSPGALVLFSLTKRSGMSYVTACIREISIYYADRIRCVT